jgi:hypothetical protein
LNVELVYSILKGITQFCYLTLEDDSVLAQSKLKNNQVEKLADGTRLTFHKIKIKDSKNWGESSYQDFMQDNWVRTRIAAAGQTSSDTLTIEQRVTVTFHMIDHF